MNISPKDLAAISSGCKSLSEAIDNPELHAFTEHEISQLVRSQLQLMLRRCEGEK